MTKYLIGTGGWAYFKVPNGSALKIYSKLFNFVEVNYTFYQNPSTQMIEGWRKIVPKDFTFSVRCHQDLTHKIGLRPTSEAYRVLYQMRTYCEILQSPYLVIETPPTYTFNQEKVKEAKDFFSTINLSGVRLVWEIRAPITRAVTNLMQDFDIIHCVDLSVAIPSYSSDVKYSRLFGKGQNNIYQFDDRELAEIDENSQEARPKTVILAYHGARMYSDAVRFQHYKKQGTFLPITEFVGVESASAVLSEDAKFPVTKGELDRNQGWKVIDLAKDKRIHLSEVLDKIPNKTYSNIHEVLEELKAVI